MTRGDIYRVRLPARRGREQHGPRYAVIVQADELLGFSTVLVAPTSRSVRAATFRPEVEIAGEQARVMVEQLRAPDIEGVATHGGPESCVGVREGVGEALAGVRAGWAIEPRNQGFRGADVVN